VTRATAIGPQTGGVCSPEALEWLTACRLSLQFKIVTRFAEFFRFPMRLLVIILYEP